MGITRTVLQNFGSHLFLGNAHIFLAQNLALSSNIVFIYFHHIQISVTIKFLFFKNATEIFQCLIRKP